MKKKRSIRSTLALFFLSPLLLVSCLSPQKPSKPPILRVILSEDPATLDPRKGRDILSFSLHFLLFEGLTRLNPDGTTTLSQAERVTLSADKKTYTFYLRTCYWSDGTPITAYDFERSWKDILKPSFPSVRAHLLYPIKNAEAAKKGLVSLHQVGIQAPDPHTLIVELEKPTPYFLELTAFCLFFPFKEGCYNGPFRLGNWKHNNELLLYKNELYWDKAHVFLDQIAFYIVPHEPTALEMYEKKEVDLLGGAFSSLPLDALPTLLHHPHLHIYPIEGTTLTIFNVQKPPFDNLYIRKAFAYALSRSSIVQNILQGIEEPAKGIVPSTFPHTKKGPLFPEGDTALAKSYLQKGLQELGGSLPPITYSYWNADIQHKIAQVLQQEWETVLGVRVQLEKKERKVLLEEIRSRSFSLVQTGWLAAYNDPMSFLERLKKRKTPLNLAGWENEAYVLLLERSALEKNPQKRLALLEKAEALLVEEMPVLPLFHWRFAFLLSPRIEHFALSPIGIVDFSRITLKQDPSSTGAFP